MPVGVGEEKNKIPCVAVAIGEGRVRAVVVGRDVKVGRGVSVAVGATAVCV